LAVNFKFYSMNKTVKITKIKLISEYDTIKRGKQLDLLFNCYTVHFSSIGPIYKLLYFK